MNSLPVSARVRLYVTLVVQVVPLVFAILAVVSSFNFLKSLLAIPFLLGFGGPILELIGQRVGRLCTLSGLTLQLLALVALVVAIVLSGENNVKMGAKDIGSLTLIFLPLAALLAWNWIGGRPRVAEGSG